MAGANLVVDAFVDSCRAVPCIRHNPERER